MDNGIDITGNLGGTSLEVTLSQAMGQIEGVVLTDRGMPAGDSSVTLVGEAYIPSHISMLTGVNENGRFTLPTVPPGTYRLYAWEDLEVAQHYDPDFLKPFESQSVSLTVKESAREQVILRQIPSAPEPHQQ
jgi:hypothetical protein